MSISHSNIANLQLPMFSLCIRSRGAFLQSWRLVIQARRHMSPTETCRVARIKTYTTLCTAVTTSSAQYYSKVLMRPVVVSGISQLRDILEMLNSRASPSWCHPTWRSSSCCLPVWNSGYLWRSSCNLWKTSTTHTHCHCSKIIKFLEHIDSLYDCQSKWRELKRPIGLCCSQCLTSLSESC